MKKHIFLLTTLGLFLVSYVESTSEKSKKIATAKEKREHRKSKKEHVKHVAGFRQKIDSSHKVTGPQGGTARYHKKEHPERKEKIDRRKKEK